MNKTISLASRFHAALVGAMALFCLWSCSKSQDAEVADLMALAGRDADLVVLAAPERLLESAGAVRQDDRFEWPAALDDVNLHSSDIHFFKTVCNIKGISLAEALVVSYSNPRLEAVVMCVTDAGAFTSSMGRNGWKSCIKGNYEEYTSDNAPNITIVNDGSYMWVVKKSSGHSATQTVDALKARTHTPVPEWLAARLTAGGDVAVRGAVIPDSSRVYLFDAGLAGPAMNLKMYCADADGQPTTFLAPGEIQPLGDIARYINPGDVASLGVALPRNFDLKGYLRLMIGNASLSDLADNMDGRFALSAGLTDPAKFAITDMSSYRGLVAIGAKPGCADRLMSLVNELIANSYMPLTVSADGDIVVVSLSGATRSSFAPEGGIAVGTVNVPADSPLLEMLPIDAGVRGSLVVNNDSAALDVAFTDTDAGFIAMILKLLALID